MVTLIDIVLFLLARRWWVEYSYLHWELPSFDLSVAVMFDEGSNYVNAILHSVLHNVTYDTFTLFLYVDFDSWFK